VDLGEVPQGRPRLRQNVAKLDELMPKGADDGHSVVTRAIAEFTNHKQSLALSSGGGGNRTAGSSPDSDDSRTVSRTGIDENTSKEHEQNALAFGYFLHEDASFGSLWSGSKRVTLCGRRLVHFQRTKLMSSEPAP